MKKTIMLALAGVATFGMAHAAVSVHLANGPSLQLTVEQTPLTEEVEAPATIILNTDSLGNASFTQADQPVAIQIFNNGAPLVKQLFSASAADNIVVSVDVDGNVIVSGTPLADGVQKLNDLVNGYLAQLADLEAQYAVNPKEATVKYDQVIEDCNTALSQYVKDNSSSPEALYALMMLDGQSFLDSYALLPQQAQSSILMPMVEQKKVREQKRVEADKKLAELENGTTLAPSFSLPDLEGKQVSLSDFKGKWVILDFWGSWCRWCIKGFPELKEISNLYADKLVIVGIDCRDSQERWRQAVEKYELSWINLYNDCTADNNPLLEAYAVQGFPTKVIVGPDGIIRKIVVGADPAFPTILSDLMSKSMFEFK